MKRITKTYVLVCLLSAVSMSASAQLSSNPDKFLGNITTSGQIDWGSERFYQLWNQITPENESKWNSVQGGGQNSWNWGSIDNIDNYAKNHHFPFKFHALVWGAQYPGWIRDLSLGARYNAIVKWMDEVKKRYPDLALIDVVNEAITGHQQDTPYFIEALGGTGKTGYDWLLKAFELAGERWPDAILIYNDFNTFQWNTDQFIDLVRTLRDAGVPIDAYGCQSHDLTDCSETSFQNAMVKLQNALKMPMYSTEYDIGTDNDNLQLQRFKEQIPYMWEADYCAGITLWGYIRHHTWTTNGNSGIIEEDGTDRPAMEWLRTYMQSDAAKNAPSPFPGMKKEASIYVHPAALKVAKEDVMPIKVRASMATKEIEKIDLYVGDELIATMTEAPYLAEYTSSTSGWKTLKAVVTTTDGSVYERLSRFQVLASTTKREPFNEVVPELPGTIIAEEFDKGTSGVAYSNVSRSTFNSTTLKTNAWMEYTVDVKEDGFYTMNVEVASTKTGGVFHLSEYSFDNLAFLTNLTEVPNTGSATEFVTLRCPMTQELTAGRHKFCLNIDKGGFYIKSMTFTPVPVIEMPGTLEMEDFNTCGDGIDFSNGNGGTVLANTNNGEWLEYLVDVKQSGKYSYEATVSSAVDNAKFSLTLIDGDGNEKSLGSVSVPQTGSLDNYQVKTGKIRNTINAGKQKLRITITNGSFNIDKINFICTESTDGITEVTDDEAGAGVSYNLSGQKVGESYRGIVVRKGKKIVVK
ncbi:MAG: endo-1,4-beta-xylanase [Prevotella sp.]|nr:endo-1,4-beta-xylanase [Prevotella sp.]